MSGRVCCETSASSRSANRSPKSCRTSATVNRFPVGAHPRSERITDVVGPQSTHLRPCVNLDGPLAVGRPHHPHDGTVRLVMARSEGSNMAMGRLRYRHDEQGRLIEIPPIRSTVDPVM